MDNKIEPNADIMAHSQLPFTQTISAVERNHRFSSIICIFSTLFSDIIQFSYFLAISLHFQLYDNSPRTLVSRCKTLFYSMSTTKFDYIYVKCIHLLH